MSTVYFRGTDNTLWAVNWNPTTGQASGQSPILAPDGKPNTTSSTPFVIPGQPLLGGGGNEPDRVYFQGTDNALWYVNSDGSGQMRVPTSTGGPNTTRSSPFVISRFPEADSVYFQGTDNTLWFLGGFRGTARRISSKSVRTRPAPAPL